MKIKSAKNKRKIVAITIAIVLVSAAGVAAFYFYNKQSSDNNKGLTTIAKKEKEESKSISQVASDSNTKEAVRLNDSPNSGDIPEEPRVTRVEQTGDYIRVSAIFSKPSNGLCVLKIEQIGQAAIQREAPVIVGPSYFACNGFRVPVSDLPTKGAWDIIVVHEVEGKTASSEKRTISVK